MNRVITIKLTREEADAMMTAGNAGVADLHDAGDDESLDAADIADAVLDRIGQACRLVGWVDPPVDHGPIVDFNKPSK